MAPRGLEGFVTCPLPDETGHAIRQRYIVRKISLWVCLQFPGRNIEARSITWSIAGPRNCPFALPLFHRVERFTEELVYSHQRMQFRRSRLG